MPFVAAPPTRWWPAVAEGVRRTTSTFADAVGADGLSAVRDLTAGAPVHLVGPDGALRSTHLAGVGA